MMTPRRALAFAHATITLIVALLASTAAASVTGGRPAARIAVAASRTTVRDARGAATEPDAPVGAAALPAPAPSIGRWHAPQASDGRGASNAAAPGTASTLDLVALHAPGAAVVARQYGVASPGQPAPSSRAPPIG